MKDSHSSVSSMSGPWELSAVSASEAVGSSPLFAIILQASVKSLSASCIGSFFVSGAEDSVFGLNTVLRVKPGTGVVAWVVLFWFSICGCIIVGFKIQVGRCVRIRKFGYHLCDDRFLSGLLFYGGLRRHAELFETAEDVKIQFVEGRSDEFQLLDRKSVV